MTKIRKEQLKDVVTLTGDQSVDGVKTFNSSPVVPAPTTDMQTATKKYVDDNAGGGGGGIVGPPYTSGQYYAALTTPALGIDNFAVPSFMIKMTPYLPLNSITIDEIAVSQTSAGDTGALMRLYIYKQNAAGDGVESIFESADIDGETQEVKKATISPTITLEPGNIYFFAHVSDGGADYSTVAREAIPLILPQTDLSDRLSLAAPRYDSVGSISGLNSFLYSNSVRNQTGPKFHFRVA